MHRSVREGKTMNKEYARREALRLMEELDAGGRRSAATRVNLYVRARNLSLSVPNETCEAEAVADGLSKLNSRRLNAMSSRTGISIDELEQAYKLTTICILAEDAKEGKPILLALLCQAICDDADIYAKSMDAERLLATALENALVK